MQHVESVLENFLNTALKKKRVVDFVRKTFIRHVKTKQRNSYLFELISAVKEN